MPLPEGLRAVHVQAHCLQVPQRPQHGQCRRVERAACHNPVRIPADGTVQQCGASTAIFPFAQATRTGGTVSLTKTENIVLPDYGAVQSCQT